MPFFVNDWKHLSNVCFIKNILIVLDNFYVYVQSSKMIAMAPHKWPRARASADARSASACRCACFFVTHASHDFPDAVSFPVKLIVLMSTYRMARALDSFGGKIVRNGSAAVTSRLLTYTSTLSPERRSSETSPR